MTNTSTTWQQAVHTTYQTSSPSCSTKAPYKKSLSLNEKCWRIFWVKKAGEWTVNRKTTGQKEQEDLAEKNERRDRKGESNDSPKVPDKRLTSDIPGLPLGFDHAIHLNGLCIYLNSSGIHLNSSCIHLNSSCTYTWTADAYTLEQLTHTLEQLMHIHLNSPCIHLNSLCIYTWTAHAYIHLNQLMHIHLNSSCIHFNSSCIYT